MDGTDGIMGVRASGFRRSPRLSLHQPVPLCLGLPCPGLFNAGKPVLRPGSPMHWLAVVFQVVFRAQVVKIYRQVHCHPIRRRRVGAPGGLKRVDWPVQNLPYLALHKVGFPAAYGQRKSHNETKYAFRTLLLAPVFPKRPR